MKIGRWHYADYDEYIDEVLEYKKPEYRLDEEDKPEEEGEEVEE